MTTALSLPSSIKLPEGEKVLWIAKPEVKPIRKKLFRGWFVGEAAVGVASTAAIIPFGAIHPVGGIIGGVLFCDAMAAFVTAAVRGSLGNQRDEAKVTTYILTNRRAIIVKKTKTSSEESYYLSPERLNSLKVTERPDGTGDLEFMTIKQGESSQTIGFKNIVNPREVKELIEENFSRTPVETQALTTTQHEWPELKIN